MNSPLPFPLNNNLILFIINDGDDGIFSNMILINQIDQHRTYINYNHK